MKFSLLILLLCLAVTASGQSQGVIPAGKLQIHYEVQGKGSPLLMLHAGYLDLHLWDKQAAHFSKQHRVIRIDLPGHGKTTGSDTTMMIQDVIRTVLDSLHIQKASCMGISLGASSLVDFAVAYPERIDKLVLVSPGLSGWPDVMQLDSISKSLFMHSDSIGQTHNRPLIAETFTHLWFDGPKRTAAQMNAVARDYVYKTALEATSFEGKSFPVFNKNTAAKRVDSIYLPVLILAGDLDVPFILTTSAYLSKHIAGSKMKVLNGVAHLINLEKPDEFDGMVDEFLKR